MQVEFPQAMGVFISAFWHNMVSTHSVPSAFLGRSILHLFPKVDLIRVRGSMVGWFGQIREISLELYCWFFRPAYRGIHRMQLCSS